MLREAGATARSQPVASVLTILVVTGMIVAVMLTTGRTVAAEQQVLGSIDSAGTRTIVVRAEDSAGLTSGVLDRVDRISGIEWAGAFSPATDATNQAIADGVRVPVRLAYGTQLNRLGIPSESPLLGQSVYASAQALESWGLVDTAGAVEFSNGLNYNVVGSLNVPDFLADFQPLALIPTADSNGTEPIGVLVIVVSSPDLVAPVGDTVRSILGADDPSKISIQTSETLAALRAIIEGQLGSVSRSLVLVILALTGSLVAILLYGLVMMRRKDYGRRRALGATRGLIILLLICQTGLLALMGILLGVAVSIAILVVTGSALPGVAFTSALAVLTMLTALVASLLPAWTASRREPIRELRVP